MDTRNLHVKNFSLVSTFIFGVFFAFGWSPCIGPSFVNVVILAYHGDGVRGKMFVFFMYCLGIILPFLMMSLFSNVLREKIVSLKKYSKIVEFLSGFLFLIVGSWILFDIFY
jgi:cytochrome c-type biogenesis protein